MTASRRLVVSIDDQFLRVIEDGVCVRVFPVSTAIKGMGFTKDSYRTPTGLFRICEKTGGGHASGTIFKARVPVGQWLPGDSPDADLVLTRILRLDGLDADNSNTLERCIYIHGTNREDLIGQPAGHGCVRLRNDDMINLFEMVAENDLVEILPATRRRGKLLFITLDSVITTLDGINELARLRGDEVHGKVCELRAGQMESGQVFLRSMDLIRPERGMCAEAAARCIAALAPGAAEFIVDVKNSGWLPVILSAGPAPLAAPVASTLGVAHFEAPPLSFHDDGSFAGAGRGYPTTGNFQQICLIRDWLQAFLPERVVMIGDAATDPETRSLVDVFIAFGAMSGRPAAGKECDIRIDGFADRSVWENILSADNPASGMA
jgi:phosphoserine phosphatase